MQLVNLQIKPILDKTRQELEKLYGKELDQMVLFGSQARGDAKPDSDASCRENQTSRFVVRSVNLILNWFYHFCLDMLAR